MPEETYSQGVVDQLVGANDSLHEQNARLRDANRILRTVVRTLRTTNDGLRRQVAQAGDNDEMFKDLCANYVPREISDRVVLGANAGLADATGTVEPLSAEGAEAS
jgi:phage tail protein X